MDKGLWQSILNLLLCNSATFLIRVRPYPCPKNLKNHLAGSAIDDLHLLHFVTDFALHFSTTLWQ